MKNKNIIKIIICLMLSCSLCVSAPLAKYQRIESHAAIAVPIAIGAGTIALMYLAACGVSYIFQGMTQAEAEDWIDTKIIEFSEISDGNGGTNGNMPSGNTNWKMTATGAILLGATLANYCEKLKNWLVGNQANNTVQEVYNNGLSYYETSENIRITVINTSFDNLDTSVTYNSVPFNYDSSSYLTYDFFDEYESVNNLKYLDQNDNGTFIGGYVYSNSIKRIFYSNIQTNRYLQIYMTQGGGGYYNAGIANILCFTSDYVPVALQVNANGTYQFRKNENYSYNNIDSSNIETIDESVSQKTETVKQNVFIENNYYTQLNPDVQTTTQDLDGVPVPLSADDIADAVWEKISMNTSATTVYKPELLPAADGFSEQANINTDDYDEPLPEPEPEPQPDWDSMNAGDVPAFTQSVWNYFMQNHNWSQLKQKFPFSLPYDAYLIANIFFDTSYDVMDELPTAPGNNRRLVKASNAPVYSFAIPKWDGTTYELVLDFSLIDPWQPIIRAAVGVLFTVGLIVGVL